MKRIRIANTHSFFNGDDGCGFGSDSFDVSGAIGFLAGEAYWAGITGAGAGAGMLAGEVGGEEMGGSLESFVAVITLSRKSCVSIPSSSHPDIVTSFKKRTKKHNQPSQVTRLNMRVVISERILKEFFLSSFSNRAW